VTHRAILESVGAGIFAIDLQGHFVYFNRSALKALGYTPEEEKLLLGTHFFELIAPQGRTEGAARARRGRERPLDDHAFRIDLRRRDGTCARVDVQMTTLWENGVVAGRVGVAQLVDADSDARDPAVVQQAVREERRRVVGSIVQFVQGLTDEHAAQGALVQRADEPLVADVKRRQALDETDLAILKLVTEGAANGEIGKHVHLSAAAVKARIGRLMRRLGASRRAELSAQALRIGIV
jgi:PAS domain S-box-containing protein